MPIGQWEDGAAVLRIGGHRDSSLPVRYRLMLPDDGPVEFEIDRDLQFPMAKRGGHVHLEICNAAGQPIMHHDLKGCAKGDAVSYQAKPKASGS